jgi:photosystem II stability/assembly factor-like uncharacterized protein
MLFCLAGALPAQVTQSGRTRVVDPTSAILENTLTARSIGPAVVGGRVSAIAMEPGNPSTFYAGAGMGGIFKTTDGGVTFDAIFEHEAVASIGDIAVAPSDPLVVWVGTGEANDRNTSTWGKGVYRSTDAGRTWSHIGLADSRVIARIAVHPADPRTAYVAAVGDLWQPSAERGLYKTADAGQTWRKVLGAAAPNDTRVGAGDVAIDPMNPNIVYAALYARQRRPTSFAAGEAATDGKDEGGIFKSEDGGATWHKLTNGLPAHTERIGLSIYTKNPSVLYATVATKNTDVAGSTGSAVSASLAGGVFRSDDRGAHWRRMSNLINRPDYAGQVRVDPTDDRRVYNLSAAIVVSDDSGKTWREDISQLHPDHHALVIDPANPRHLIEANDGGVYQSFSGGATWEHLSRFAAGEFRSVNIDRSIPYRVCGGLQDNGTWVGPSTVLNTIGIRNGDWQIAAMNDGGYCVFDDGDSTILYWSTNSKLRRTDFRAGHNADVTPGSGGNQGGGAAAATLPLNWTPPLIGSHHHRGVVYLGANRVIKLSDHAELWEAISPDLTRGGTPGGRPAISALVESPVAPGVLWAGTDNGKVWRTSDEGAHWTDVGINLPATAQGHWVNRVEASRAGAHAGYVVVAAYRDGNQGPLVYATVDSGRSWRDISGNLPRTEPVRVVREDPDNVNVLYAGTEYGLWLTLDGGRSWSRFGNLPTVAVDEIVIEPRTHDLVIATQGRGLYIIDQTRAVAQTTQQVLAEPLHLYAPEPAVQIKYIEGLLEGAQGNQYAGQNPPMGAILTYYVNDGDGDAVDVKITSATGAPVANFVGPASSGLNRVLWDLRQSRDMRAGFQGTLGARYLVPPGTYTVSVTHGTARSTQRIEVQPGPGLLKNYNREWPSDIRP